MADAVRRAVSSGDKRRIVQKASRSYLPVQYRHLYIHQNHIWLHMLGSETLLQVVKSFLAVPYCRRREAKLLNRPQRDLLVDGTRRSQLSSQVTKRSVLLVFHNQDVGLLPFGICDVGLPIIRIGRKSS